VLAEYKNYINNTNEEIKKLKTDNNKNLNEILDNKKIINNLENENYRINNSYNLEHNDYKLLQLKIEKLENLIESKDNDLIIIKEKLESSQALSEGIKCVLLLVVAYNYNS